MIHGLLFTSVAYRKSVLFLFFLVFSVYLPTYLYVCVSWGWPKWLTVRIPYARDLAGQEQEKAGRTFRPRERPEVCGRKWKGRATKVGAGFHCSAAPRQVDWACGESLSQRCPWWRSPMSHRTWPASCPHMLSHWPEQPVRSLASGCPRWRIQIWQTCLHSHHKKPMNSLSFFCFWNLVILPVHVGVCAI